MTLVVMIVWLRRKGYFTPEFKEDRRTLEKAFVEVISALTFVGVCYIVGALILVVVGIVAAYALHLLGVT